MKSAEEFYQLVGVSLKDGDEPASAVPTKLNKREAVQGAFEKCPGCSLAARLAKEEDTRLKKAEAAKCPGCGKAVNWDSLSPKQMPEPWLLDFLFESPAVLVKECPLCGYAEELKEA